MADQGRASRAVLGVLVLALCAPMMLSGSVAAQVACPPPPPGPGTVTWEDTTVAAGLHDPLLGMFGHAVAVGDVNGDGWQDIFVGTFADRPEEQYRERGGTEASPDRLLLGRAGGQFTVDTTFPPMYGLTTGAAFADLDADGDLDLVLTRYYRDVPKGREPSVLLRNDGGRLTQILTLATQSGGRGIGVLDYDRDGRLDLFVAADRFTAGASSVLLRNTGGLTFTDVTAAAGLPPGLQGFGVATSDLNGDGVADLLVAGVHPRVGETVTGPAARLFVGTGGGFREVSIDAFPWTTFDEYDDVTSVAVADLNRDGRPDIVLGQHYLSTVPENTYGPTVVQGKSVAFRVYVHRGSDTEGVPSYEDVTVASGIPEFATKVPNVEIADVDNDGWPDLLTSVTAALGTAPAVFRNRGVVDGIPRFDAPAGLGDRLYWVTSATGDFDRDGRLDAMMIHFEPEEPSRLFLNRTVAGGWLRVEVDAPHRGLGAMVEVYCAGRLGEPSALVGRREIEAQSGYAAGVPAWAHFGLGALTTVDVRVRPPGGAAVVDRAAVPAGATLRVPLGPPGTSTTTSTTTTSTSSTSTPTTSTPTTTIPTAPTYLSALTPTVATNGYGPYERDRANGGPGAGDGPPLRIAGRTYARGLGTHSSASLTYTIPAGSRTFLADLGLDDTVRPEGSVVFRVHLDNNTVPAFDSGRVTGASPVRPVSVDVAGRTTLRLVVTDGGDGGSYDWADWADARLTGASPSSTTTTAAAATSTTTSTSTSTTSTSTTTTSTSTTTTSTTTSTTTIPTAPTYLSALTPTVATNGYGPYERDRANGGPGAGDGPPLRIAGRTYARGLGTHSSASLTYTIPAGSRTFLADLGLDDTVRPEGSVVFRVHLDNSTVPAFDSGRVTGASPVRPVSVDVAGRTTLRLVVTDGGDGGSYDWADWADARLTGASPSSTTTTAAAATSTTTSTSTTTTSTSTSTTSTTTPTTTTPTTTTPTAPTYLSALTPTVATNGYGPYERDRANGGPGAGDGPPLRIAGRTYARGLGTHSSASLTYTIPAGSRTFLADLGLDDTVRPEGSVVFHVYLDNSTVPAFDSGRLTGASPVRPVSVDVAGRTTLRLVVTDGGDGGSYDWADWADARLVR